MALAYPEGECFFRRSGLNSPSGWHYRADNPQHFYSHFMLEYIWNKPADHSHWEVNNPHGWPQIRSGYSIVKGSLWNTLYGNYQFLPFQYGADHRTGITRRIQHNLCVHGNTFRDREKGGAYQAWFMTMPMPTDQEKWVWIDLLAGIRAIYIPLAHRASEDYDQICTFLHISFTHTGEVRIWSQGDQFLSFTCNTTDGLGVRRDHTIGINMYGLMNLLSLPRQLRNETAFTSKLVRVVPSTEVQTRALGPTYWNDHDFDWVMVAGANYGLSLQWAPHQPTTWFQNFFGNVMTIAIGFIPIVGPVLSVSFSFAWTALTDPDSFLDAIRNEYPALDLTLYIIERIKNDAAATAAYLPPGWDQVGQPLQIPFTEVAKLGAKEQKRHGVAPVNLDEIGPSVTFLLAKEILEHTAHSPAALETPDAAEDDRPEETLASVSATNSQDPSYETLFAEKDINQGSPDWAEDYIRQRQNSISQ
ncbi:hypothetical protein L228DRAFT_249930 [Xylona heveae TC161]|uniref:Uncharacterized protein n=1 Tax=Xylona heveae (strain CBS 132557 / TC161) TaxID=1328760 RepID=A0A165ACH6_XYLHT|nr:hypothetical protein L228DRAFT_249930 [Xylona heveae TC161]KZF20251.1 hypothetical protein L228DRAFT_249930 [Xylona heveae TC161]